jgi:hypothetical protein
MVMPAKCVIGSFLSTQNVGIVVVHDDILGSLTRRVDPSSLALSALGLGEATAVAVPLEPLAGLDASRLTGHPHRSRQVLQRVLGHQPIAFAAQDQPDRRGVLRVAHLAIDRVNQ